MKCAWAATALIAASAGTAYGATHIKGNWYGKAVDQIIYSGWGQGGTYSRVTDMSNGQCKMEDVAWSGGMSPLDGEVSEETSASDHADETGIMAFSRTDAPEAVRLLYTRHKQIKTRHQGKSARETSWSLTSRTKGRRCGYCHNKWSSRVLD